MTSSGGCARVGFGRNLVVLGAAAAASFAWTACSSGGGSAVVASPTDAAGMQTDSPASSGNAGHDDAASGVTPESGSSPGLLDAAAGDDASDAATATDALQTAPDAPGGDGATTGGGGFDAAPFPFDSGAMTHVIVAADGSGQFKTVQAAFDSIPATNTAPVEIDVRPGTYNEKPILPAGKGFVTLIGTDPDPAKTVITHGDTMANGIATFMTPTVQILADDFSAANLTIENSWVPTASGQNQALALSIKGNRQQFRNCRFVSYQDTVYVGGGTQYFKNCFVQGSVDYIFGPSTAVFDGCTMYNVISGSAVVAPSTLQATPYGIVFLGGQLTAAASVSKVALARPWQSSYAAVAFLNVALGAHITSAGWTTMAPKPPPAMVPDLSLVRFFEYKSTGPGANPAARTTYQLTDAQAATYTLANIFGSWLPSLSK